MAPRLLAVGPCEPACPPPAFPLACSALTINTACPPSAPPSPRLDTHPTTLAHTASHPSTSRAAGGRSASTPHTPTTTTP
eukprot:scaffold79577_cov36-Phaeocystis_antarctica.AAC.1